MTTGPERQRLPLLIAISVVAVLAVVGAVIVLPTILPGPGPTPSPSASRSALPSPDPSTPEGATRAFFEAFADARRSGDPGVVRPFVTGEASSAFLTVEGFLRGQTEAGKASITTVLLMENIRPTVSGDAATVVMDFTEGGYDTDLDSGDPLESPAVLPTREVTVELRRVDGAWLVERFETAL